MRRGDAIAAAAKRFPDTSFAIVDVDQSFLKGKPANVQGLLFREEQVGYLVGYLGALEAKRAGAASISAVGGYKEPPVDRFIAGYKAGAEAAVPGTKVRWDYSQDWEDQAEVQGARAEPDRGGLEGRLPGRRWLRARRAVGGEGRRRVGDRGRRRPVVPRPACPHERAEGRRQRRLPHDRVESVKDGTFEGGKNVVFGIDQDGVGLGTTSPKANDDDVAAVDEVEQQLAAGEITDIPTTLK